MRQEARGKRKEKRKGGYGFLKFEKLEKSNQILSPDKSKKRMVWALSAIHLPAIRSIPPPRGCRYYRG